MKKIKFITLGLGLTTMPIAIVPAITSCGGNKPSSDVKVSSISLTGKNYVLTNRSYSYTAKVLPDNATNKDVTWSIEKPEGSTADAFVDAYGTIQFRAPGEINLIATAKDGSKVKGTINVYGLDETQAQEISKYYFCNDDWSEICDFANQGYDALLNHYAGLKTLTNPFIGLERTITLNGQKHIVRVIGENHDTIAGTSNKAALTFELVTLLSDNAGTAMTSYFSTGPNNDYPNSILRKNLTGNGSYSGEHSWSKPAIELLKAENQNLFNNLKIISKQSAISASSFNSYEDKLFPLSYTEMAQSGSSLAAVEGTAYKYWSDHNTDNDRIKKDVKQTLVLDPYFLVSPDLVEHDRVWCITPTDGKIGSGYLSTAEKATVSFAFCI